MKDFEAGIILGVVVSTLLCWFLWMATNSKTAIGWCDDIAQHDTTSTYQVSYDKCMAEWEQRRK